jgi:hypothetical protein
MSTLVTRSGKGSPLTHNEVDTNFTNLNTDKVEKTAADITGGTINNTTIGATTPSTGVFTTLTAQNETLKGTGQNFLTYSQTFQNAAWVKQTNVTATDNATTAPDGTSTAASVTWGSASNGTGIYQFKTGLSWTGISNTKSIYVRADVAGGTVVLVDAGFGGSTTTLTLSTSWQRVTVTESAQTNAAGLWIQKTASSPSTIYIWGGQLEIGTTANTYIPTTATAVYGTPTLSFSGVASIGLQSDGSLYETSAGTGNVRFYTNNIGQEQARVSHTASAVNYHQLTGSATGSGPIHSVAGSDTNIDLNLTTKGTGAVKLNMNTGTLTASYDTAGNQTFFTGTGNLNIAASSGGAQRFFTRGTLAQQFQIQDTGSSVNYVQVTGGATGSAVNLSAQGSDTNIQFNINSKNAFGIQFGTGGGTQFLVSNTAAAANYLRATGGATGFGAVLSAQGSDTNIPLVLQPKGTGALQAQQTDSTATGGNARGANAVDWQTGRNSAGQVASGPSSVVGGGKVNTAAGFGTVVAGGDTNSANGQYTFVGGGTGNTASTNLGTIVGGATNTAAGYYNFIGAGFTNSGTASAAVTTQSGTMNGTTAVTLSGSNASIKVGQYITGTSIAGETYVAAISGTSLTLSKVASGSSTSTLSFYTPHGVVVGGGNNQATGSYSFIGGGGDAGTAANRNVASGDWSTVGGGRGNQASGAGAFIGGGGFDGVTISANAVSGLSAVVSGGMGNNSSGYNAVVSGGRQNQANSTVGTINGGGYGTSRGITGYTVSPASFSPIGTFLVGTSQAALLVLGVQTTDATATVLRSDTSAASGTNQVILPPNSAYAFRGTVIANVTGGGNTKAWAIEGAIKRGATAASTALVGTPTVTSAYADVGAATWAIAVTADTTNGGLAVTFTGQAATTIRCVAKLETTEVTF